MRPVSKVSTQEKKKKSGSVYLLVLIIYCSMVLAKLYGRGTHMSVKRVPVGIPHFREDEGWGRVFQMVQIWVKADGTQLKS